MMNPPGMMLWYDEPLGMLKTIGMMQTPVVMNPIGMMSPLVMMSHVGMMSPLV